MGGLGGVKTMTGFAEIGERNRVEVAAVVVAVAMVVLAAAAVLSAALGHNGSGCSFGKLRWEDGCRRPAVRRAGVVANLPARVRR